MKTALPPRGQISAIGETLYQEKLRHQLEPEHNGKIAVINIETAEYELDASHLKALKRARARWPEGLFYGVRVGYPTMGHIGARLRPRTK